MIIKYPTLERLIDVRHIRKKDIAAELGISMRSLQYKLAGRTEFTWGEIEKLQSRFFHDMTKEELMSTK